MNQQEKPSNDDASRGKDPDMQGEGNYTATRRYRESVEEFLDSGRLPAAAQEAAPKSEAEAREMKQAEEAGKAPARK